MMPSIIFPVKSLLNFSPRFENLWYDIEVHSHVRLYLARSCLSRTLMGFCQMVLYPMTVLSRSWRCGSVCFGPLTDLLDLSKSIMTLLGPKFDFVLYCSFRCILTDGPGADVDLRPSHHLGSWIDLRHNIYLVISGNVCSSPPNVCLTSVTVISFRSK